jgi:hypothetical protein
MLSNGLDDWIQQHEKKTNPDEARNGQRDQEPTSLVKWDFLGRAASLLPMHSDGRRWYYNRAGSTMQVGSEICSVIWSITSQHSLKEGTSVDA